MGPRVSSWRPRAGSSAGDQGVFRSSSEAARSPEGIWDRRLRHCCDALSKRGCSGSRSKSSGVFIDLYRLHGASVLGTQSVVMYVMMELLIFDPRDYDTSRRRYLSHAPAEMQQGGRDGDEGRR
ncbi:uncharacterized protein [Lolium perenne]|uniref:uncharacterized protein isoform X1 n=1 Tax=Lolium perenne TaxID=4522 RepID=UPI0021F61642|nr:uncharacterized protein LOC127299858 isoform X2 [Lolium perenne]XP_051185854.1 uncharacterized protein LOC127299858 isoform X2 [Lolium perenne]